MKQFTPSDALKRLPEQFFAHLVDRVEQAKSLGGMDIINLGQGNPDQPTPDHIVASLQQAAEKPLYHKYPPFKGFSFLKEAVATFYKKEYGVELDANKEVAILFGSKTGLVEVSQCFLNKGDVAFVPDPGYPDYWSGIALANGVMKKMPLVEERGFLPDYNQLDPKDLQRAKLLFLNYPNNPTGAVANRAFFEETIQLAEEHNVCVVHDFAYGAIGFDGKKPLSFMQVEGAKQVGVEMYTMSKTFNMAGWRVGFAVGNPSVIQALELMQDHYYVSVFGAVQEATATALLDSEQSVNQLVATYERRRDKLIAGLEQLGWHVAPCKGSFFVWMRVPDGFTSEQFANDLIDKVRVVVAPGIGFGSYGEGYVRIGLVSSEQQIEEALRRFTRYMKDS
ncbi:pyridoxal phosphate-dependent aminotransferase [Pontibacillus litoralis]|uniref:Diaminopimelate aminotransferase n=1 Tax=Pontibacillus litoralis JSM 072002 TaxID=1385512 RepID=A0A0A5FY74_9BACI|nr:pyridoxal phosphate-dependent aminotransferase [Pontibacillus litoralis]KGX85771.1 diaminopimelate aminotransferase [Pontibacillus litoralis JSM 072002]